MNPPSFDTMRHAYLDTLDYIKDHATLLQPVNGDIMDALAAQAKVATTWTQLGSLALLTPLLNTGMRPISPLTSTPMATTLFQPGNTTLDWYFMYSNSGNEAFTFILFAIPLCVPDIAKAYKLNEYDTFVYSPSAGYGKRAGEWSTSPKYYCQGIYTPLSESTFHWEAVLANDGVVTRASFDSLSLGSFHLVMAWQDRVGSHSIDSTLMSINEPTYNGEQGCVPCIAGLGTSYWSYTNMKTETIYNGEKPVHGVGWLDHQWLQAGKVSGNVTAALLNTLSWWMPSPKTTRWFWITIQDAMRNVQYMILVSNPHLLTEGKSTFDVAILNRYDGHQPLYMNGTQAKVTVTETLTIDEYVYPMKYAIQLFDGDVRNYILEAAFGHAIIHLPNGVPNIESPGILYDASNPTMPIGTGFLESNQMAPDDVIRETNLLQSGIPIEQWSLFANTDTPTSVVWLSVLFLLMLVALCIIIVYYAVAYIRKRREVA